MCPAQLNAVTLTKPQSFPDGVNERLSAKYVRSGACPHGREGKRHFWPHSVDNGGLKGSLRNTKSLKTQEEILWWGRKWKAAELTGGPTPGSSSPLLPRGPLGAASGLVPPLPSPQYLSLDDTWTGPQRLVHQILRQRIRPQ